MRLACWPSALSKQSSQRTWRTVVSSLTCTASWPVLSSLISTWQVSLKLTLFIKKSIYWRFLWKWLSISQETHYYKQTDSLIIGLERHHNVVQNNCLTVASFHSSFSTASCFLFSLDQRRLRSSSGERCGRPVDSQPPCLLSSSSSSSRPPSVASTTASHHLSASPQSGPFGGEQTVILYALLTGYSLEKHISPPKHWLS